MLKKAERAKAKRAPQGDQQKLKRGVKLTIKPKIEKKQVEERAQSALTKKITMRIEQTMAARAGTDGGGLKMVKLDDTSAQKQLREASHVLKASKR